MVSYYSFMYVLIIIIIIIITFRKYVGNIPASHAVLELQKTAILGTAHTFSGKC